MSENMSSVRVLPVRPAEIVVRAGAIRDPGDRRLKCRAVAIWGRWIVGASSSRHGLDGLIGRATCVVDLTDLQLGPGEAERPARHCLAPSANGRPGDDLPMTSPAFAVGGGRRLYDAIRLFER
jgi:hypothetical protein